MLNKQEQEVSPCLSVLIDQQDEAIEILSEGPGRRVSLTSLLNTLAPHHYPHSACGLHRSCLLLPKALRSLPKQLWDADVVINHMEHRAKQEKKKETGVSPLSNDILVHGENKLSKWTVFSVTKMIFFILEENEEEERLQCVRWTCGSVSY